MTAPILEPEGPALEPEGPTNPNLRALRNAEESANVTKGMLLAGNFVTHKYLLSVLGGALGVGLAFAGTISAWTVKVSGDQTREAILAQNERLGEHIRAETEKTGELKAAVRDVRDLNQKILDKMITRGRER